MCFFAKDILQSHPRSFSMRSSSLKHQKKIQLHNFLLNTAAPQLGLSKAKQLWESQVLNTRRPFRCLRKYKWAMIILAKHIYPFPTFWFASDVMQKQHCLRHFRAASLWHFKLLFFYYFYFYFLNSGVSWLLRSKIFLWFLH